MKIESYFTVVHFATIHCLTLQLNAYGLSHNLITVGNNLFSLHVAEVWGLYQSQKKTI